MALSEEIIKIKAYIQAEYGDFLTLRKRLMALRSYPEIRPTAEQMLIDIGPLEQEVNATMLRLNNLQVDIRDLPDLIGTYAKMRTMVANTASLEQRVGASSTSGSLIFPSLDIPKLLGLSGLPEIPIWAWGIIGYVAFKSPKIVLIPLAIMLLKNKLLGGTQEKLGLTLTPMS